MKHLPITAAELAATCAQSLNDWELKGRSVLILIPDGTRSCPLGALFLEVYACLADRVESLDFMIALGTHEPMDREAIARRLELSVERLERDFPKARFSNHRWGDESALVEIGRWSRAEVEELSGGRLSLEVPIRINRAVLEYEHLLILGPVFPHEVAGYSGGNKYLFPGIAGPDIIHFFHWLGALVTNHATIGEKHTLVRAVIDRAASLLNLDRRALCMVVEPAGGLMGLFGGSPEQAWSDAADLSAQVHVQRRSRAFHTVLSCAPPMYPDLWTGGKCMYKLEPVVADGGSLIIYAPHIREVSRVHGAVIEAIGYHVRDYFVAQWDRFSGYPWGILAHSTHVRGLGSYVDGIERPRVKVVLATGITPEVCARISLGYQDPREIDPETFADREDEGVLYVPRAGEMLHRLDQSQD